MTDSKNLTGTCLCGSVSVQFPIETDQFSVCHCSMCRKWSGGPALNIEASGKPLFKGEDQISVFSSSKWAERGFCRSCGTHLFYRLKKSKYYNFPIGLLQDNEKLKFVRQIFIDNKPSNYEFANKTELLTEAQVIALYSQK